MFAPGPLTFDLSVTIIQYLSLMFFYHHVTQLDLVHCVNPSDVKHVNYCFNVGFFPPSDIKCQWFSISGIF